LRRADPDNPSSIRSLARLARNLNNKPAARNNHTAQPEAEPTLNRFALKPLALRGPAFTSQPGSGSGRLRLACCTGRSSGPSGAIRTLQFLIRQAYVASVLEDGDPVEWVRRQAIVRLPDNVDLSNAGPVGEELLAVINRGAAALIVDMTATSSCDYAGADVLARAYQGVVATGTQLRLVAPDQVLRRVLSLNGLDPLISVYPSREAAIAAGEPAANAATAAGAIAPQRGTARQDRPQPSQYRPQLGGRPGLATRGGQAPHHASSPVR
jgi:anti-sigma B factor antagonist